MLQSWLYFGLLEAITEKMMIHTSYLVRPDSSERQLLYSQNRAFCLRGLGGGSRRQSLPEIEMTPENARHKSMAALANT